MSILTCAAHGVGQQRYRIKKITANETAKNLCRYFVDTTSGPVQISLPTFAQEGFKFLVRDNVGKFSTNNCTVANNGQKIMGVTDNYVLDTNYSEREFEKISETDGWIVRRAG